MNNTKQDPILKWVGGKRWLIKYLLSIWKDNSDCRLVEPFVGGMAISLGLQPKSALLNDANPYLINFYRHVQSGLEVTIPMENEKVFYYKQRARFNQLVELGLSDTNEAAQLFYYLIKNCYNGLCRLNQASKFNSPFGQYSKVNYAKDFFSYQQTLSKYKFVNGDFKDLVLDRGDLVYVDPPYDTPFTQYTNKTFSWKDQVRLVDYLSDYRGKVIASNRATERILDLYKSNRFSVQLLDGPTSISSNGDRKPVLEMLAFKGF
jgi:DNA adenine methylase